MTIITKGVCQGAIDDVVNVEGAANVRNKRIDTRIGVIVNY